MPRKPKLGDRIRGLVEEIYAEFVAVGALPVSEVTFLRELLYRGLEGRYWPRALRIIRNDPDIDSMENNPEDFDEWLPDPETKMEPCQHCGQGVAVPLDFKHPLGTWQDFYCHRSDCVTKRRERDARWAEIDRRIAADESIYDVPVSKVEPEDPQSAEVKRLQREWGVEKIKASRGRTLKSLPPISPEVIKPQRLQHHLTLREVAALLDIKGFADVFRLDEVRLYRDYASGNYSQRQLEARVIGKKYPTIHLENFKDNLTLLENAIVIRGLELNRIKPRVHTGMDTEPTRGENEPAKRNGVPIGQDPRPGMAPGIAEKDFSQIEAREVQKTERKFPRRPNA
jgi:hypothetical protein